ncbi:MAG: hypothetical protein CVU56_26115 [Deltaproteobacteria bacterium HGW-Deltaproteobacteria-14]|jgi:hypothetical protein|nr:MAG: hypothetical protein CVU56_26115 [Deltaproteobacteria bacterium HGW-Deltaproteobacteria-14]
MKRYNANQPAPYGLYISPRHLDIRFVGADGEPLEGKAGVEYRRIPTWLIVVFGPALGGIFVLAFPLLVLGAVIGTLGAAVVKAFGHRHGYVARSGWQPAAAYFDKKQGPHAEGEARAPELDDLEAEVTPKADAEKRETE